ncbi:hypothetical protein AAHE18_14G073200 [Arachis hypogaea]
MNRNLRKKRESVNEVRETNLVHGSEEWKDLRSVEGAALLLLTALTHSQSHSHSISQLWNTHTLSCVMRLSPSPHFSRSSLTLFLYLFSFKILFATSKIISTQIPINYKIHLNKSKIPTPSMSICLNHNATFDPKHNSFICQHSLSITFVLKK